jgi:DNA polymerase
MPSELSSLIAGIRENILFLQELGVSDLQADLSALKIESQPDRPVEQPAIARAAPPADLLSKVNVARPAAARAEPKKTPASKLDLLNSTRLSQFSGSSATAKNTESRTPSPIAKPKETIKKEPAAADSLFGDIAPVNELAPTTETLAGIHGAIDGCRLCPLHEGRTKIVNSTGNPKAELMFIGEAPGADEDAQGKPFVGRAGQLLTKIIEAMGLDREQVFIGNINRCRPPQNRAPLPDEVAMCKPFLLREIAVVRPKIIVVMGNTAMQNLLEIKAPIGKLRGNFQDYFGIKVMPTFHPAYLLRDPHKKREVWEDMKKVKAALEGSET